MSEKHVVVQGAECKCQFGSATDKLKVLSQTKHYANDKQGSNKLIATNLDKGGATLQENTFGNCSKKNNNPCTPSITEWQSFYEEVELSNGGKILLEDSKATCPTGSPGCITFVTHGQIAEPCAQNFKNGNAEMHGQLNPLVRMNAMLAAQPAHGGCEDASK
ncbi:DUF4280 domain-containing protein [Chitinophagaceae bacterium 26-R-25]|nr:DUF4280 domain-containing protein [Chitinophagaceae bacterium 26-R-25]